MNFIKRSIVLKEIESGFSIGTKSLSGIARLEFESGVLDFYLTLVSIRPIDNGEYFVGILNDQNNMSLLNLGKRPSSFHSMLEPFDPSNGFAIGLILIKDDIPLTIAFAKEQTFNLSLTDFKRALADKCLSTHKFKLKEPSPTNPPIYEPHPDDTPNAPIEEPIDEPTETPLDDKIFNVYNDEAVATENYFDFSDVETKLNLIKEYDFASLQPENELPFNQSQEKAEECTNFPDRAQNETNLNFGKKTEKERPYYQSVQTELNAVLNKFPPEENLNKLFHDGKFVKVNYSKEKYYVVGIIKENGKEKYLCYGVPGKFSPNPPKELAGYCSFIPLSVFDLSGEGYWMMFQDAISGKCINASPVE